MACRADTPVAQIGQAPLQQLALERAPRPPGVAGALEFPSSNPSIPSLVLARFHQGRIASEHLRGVGREQTCASDVDPRL